LLSKVWKKKNLRKASSLSIGAGGGWRVAQQLRVVLSSSRRSGWTPRGAKKKKKLMTLVKKKTGRKGREKKKKKPKIYAAPWRSRNSTAPC